MSGKSQYERWEELSKQAHSMAGNIALQIGRIHNSLSNHPELISKPRERYMTTSLENLLEVLTAVDTHYVYRIQDLIWTDDEPNSGLPPEEDEASRHID